MLNSKRILMRSIGFIAAAFAAAMLAACVTSPSQPDKAAAAETGPVFYPPLPNAPRIQYLTTIASERDLAFRKDSFADFIVGEEKDAKQLTQPYGIAMHQGRLFVADTGAGGIAIFDLAQQRFSFVTGAGAGRMKRPINIRIDSDGTRYVTDTGRDQILVYDRDDRFIKAFGVEGQFRPVDVAIAGERLYVTDILHHQIHALEKATGRTLFKFGKPGSAEGELFHPTNLALGPDGDIYVVETSNFRVQRFTAEGKPVKSYGSVGMALGNFARPKGIAMDRAGRMYVGDAAFQNVQMFDGNGKLLMFFGQTEGRTDGLNLPAGVTIDYDNVAAFRRFADPQFKLEYLILVASQFGPNKVDIFGFGKMDGKDYSETPAKPAS
ncbi:MAG: SMP-30/gluconolactonase/LRE family protein [Nevskiales bacterium]